MGYGIVDTDGRKHKLVTHGAIRAPRNAGFPARLLNIDDRLTALVERYAPHVCSIEETFYALNVKTALNGTVQRTVRLEQKVDALAEDMVEIKVELAREIGFRRDH